jgi:hypothetical protein
MDYSSLVHDAAILFRNEGRWDVRLLRLIDRGNGVSK